jgi:hypothetical protein
VNKEFSLRSIISVTNHALCQEAFQEAFANDTVPNKTTIYCIVTNSEETGCVCDRKRDRCRAVLNDDTLEDMRLKVDSHLMT